MNRSRLYSVMACSVALCALPQVGTTQEILLQENFNDDGSIANPPRYTVEGGFKSEPPHNEADVTSPADQAGPVYWARNTEVSFVGVPAPTAGRRALLVWDGAIATTEASADMIKLIGNTVKWLAKDKANPSIVVAPNIAAAQGLVDDLIALGYTSITDDDATIPEASVTADVLIKGIGAGPSRFAASPQGVLTFSALDHDDMLVGSIGSTATFTAGSGSVVATGHPIAAGIPATFTLAPGDRTWNLMGDTLPGGSTTIANFVRVIPPGAANLADVEAMAAGTKTATKSTETVTELDFSDASVGDWTSDLPIPGGAAGVWGMVAKGKLNVATAGTYSFALGIDDGARLRIDRNKNGFGPEDDVIVSDVAGAHRAVYGDAAFTATGPYDFEVTMFNSGGGGDVEMSVSINAGGGDVSAISSGSWELLGQTSGSVTLDGVITADVYVPSGPDVEVTLPLLVVLNGPTDTPPGSVFGGGPFEGFEGAGFFGAAGLNKWLTLPIEDLGGYRSVRLKPVNVTGKQNVKLTIALAASFLDFETSDFLEIIAYPSGESSEPVTLARYSAPNDSSKFFVDVTHGNINRLGLRFQDVTYDVPATATDLIIEIRAFTSWWNEIAAFDNIRVTAGAVATGPSFGATTLSGGEVQLAWTGGQGPFLVQWSPTLPATWINLVTTAASTASVPPVGPAGFFRIQNNAAGTTVKMYKAILSGAAEVPAVDTPAKGSAVIAVEGDKLSYYVSYQGLKDVANNAHIHGPAPVTESAGVLFPITPVPGFGRQGILVGTHDLTAAEKTNLEAGMTYVNIHSGAHPGGEIRGQVVPVP